MDPKTFHRKLAAILSADVAGYSRLMQDDEAATVATLETYKQVFSDLIKQHRGRVVDSPGRQPAGGVRQRRGRRAVRGGGAEGAAGAQRRAARRTGACCSASGSTWET